MNSSSTAQDANHAAQSERLRSLGQLVAGVIHELNNPLNIVNANLQILREYLDQQRELIALYQQTGVTSPEIEAHTIAIDWPFLSEDLPRTLTSCLEGAGRARSLVDDLRRFSIANQSEVGPVDLRRLITSTVRLVESSYRSRVEFKLECDQLPPIQGITGHIQQVLMNLIVNAVQAIPEKGTITLRSRATEAHVTLEIQDNGTGIPPEVLPRIFEPYFSTKGPGEGTGLGLCITKRIIEKHGGRLHVESSVGQGTSFQIVLPLECDRALLDDPGSPYDL
ncbi:MAG: ATP-binding protein [Candidatus Sericytochromatia bacterium]|nr:ATP-binding protein [Candidatus Sericytochromatia bacterium]